MKSGFIVAALIVVPMLITSAWAFSIPSDGSEPLDGAIAAIPPDYVGGYGFDPQTQTMEDTNGFRYSYQPDGVVRLDLPWGYTTHFSFGLTADYLGSPEKRTALDYTWNWTTDCTTAFDGDGNLTGYEYSFTATAIDGVLGWEITLDFSPTSRMKVTHTLTNGYANDLTNVNFWWLFDLTGTATPYTIETSAGTVEGLLYAPIPDDIYWVRLGNQFQFDWRDALEDYDNGHVYIGDGSVVGLDGLPILGISIELGTITPGARAIVDPFFSGVEKTWDAGSAGDASGVANWDPVGVPETGDNVTYDATSTENCNWDVEVTLGNFSMLTGYSGTVTQSADFGCVNFSATAGEWVGSITEYLTVTNDFSQTVSWASVSTTWLNMTAEDDAADLYMLDDNWLKRLTISGNVTFDSPTLRCYTHELLIESTGAFTIDGVTPGASTYHTSFFSTGSITIESGGGIIVSADKRIGLETYNPPILWSNQGEVSGDGGISFLTRNYDIDLTPGTISTDILLGCGVAMGADYEVRLLGPVSTTGTLTIKNPEYSAYSFTLDAGGYDVTVDSTFTLGVSSVVLDAGVWSVGSYIQSGADSIFNQGAALTIGGDFTISAGEFIGSDDAITVAGDWDTDGYTHGDNAVTLTGDTKTLVMAATESFYNVTIASGANYTMDDDTTVDLRATITGILYGAGDFIEPLPGFTSDPWQHACPHEVYEYTPTQLYWDTLALDDGPYWIHLVDGAITGVPNDNDTGIHYVVLTLTWNDMVTYQNYSIIVCPDLLSDAEVVILGVSLSLVIGLGLLTLGLWFKYPIFIVFAGFIWLLSAITVYADISMVWAIMGIGIGTVIMFVGGLQIVDESEI